uniref:Neuronal membrane glycoprotein M6-a n=1 Tax=Pavo cristatus TaxID=9049 RepID=A0A8C9FQV9_PAVCR
VGCFECCIKCLGGIPYASLIATILLYAGVALFCGCGHEALSGTVNILQTYFEMTRAAGDVIDYVIYGVAAAFFVYGILLMVEGFFTTGAIKDLYGDFKITTCGRCVSAWVNYFQFLPMRMFQGIKKVCEIVPCSSAFCLLYLSKHQDIFRVGILYYIPCTDVYSTVTLIKIGLLMLNSMLLLLQVHYLMVLSANWAYVKDACRMQKYEDIKSKEEQELHDIHSTRSKERL